MGVQASVRNISLNPIQVQRQKGPCHLFGNDFPRRRSLILGLSDCKFGHMQNSLGHT